MGEGECIAGGDVSMGQNYFGRTSRLNLISEYKNGRTELKEASFTAPFKVMQPFYPQGDSGRMQVMALSASAGLMEGDRQEIRIEAGKNSKMELFPQSYEKIHKMPEGYASRRTEIHVEKGASFQYNPVPAIPFAGSAFQSTTTAYLEDETSRFILGEIVSCGRYSHGERFRYRYYQSRIRVYCRRRLIYMDNTYFEPSDMDMEEIGMLEGFSHMGNLLLFHTDISYSDRKKIQSDLLEKEGIEGGASVTAGGDVVIRMLGNSSQALEEAVEAFVSERRG